MSTLQTREAALPFANFFRESERAIRQITRSARLMGKSDVGAGE